MRTKWRISFVVVLSSIFWTGVGTAHTGPALKVARLTPLTLRGTGFRSEERVQVTLVRTDRVVADRSVRATTAGTFSIRFALFVAVEPCRSLEVRAVGAQGSRATYVHRCRPPDPALP